VISDFSVTKARIDHEDVAVGHQDVDIFALL
jgi:hypothetical protein